MNVLEMITYIQHFKITIDKLDLSRNELTPDSC